MGGAAIPPGSWLGLLGGGQLGRMFCMAAQSLGYKVCVLDPGSDSPAGAVADDHIATDYLDRAGLAELARRCRAATTEFENVPAAAHHAERDRPAIGADGAGQKRSHLSWDVIARAAAVCCAR